MDIIRKYNGCSQLKFDITVIVFLLNFRMELLVVFRGLLPDSTNYFIGISSRYSNGFYELNGPHLSVVNVSASYMYKTYPLRFIPKRLFLCFNFDRNDVKASNICSKPLHVEDVDMIDAEVRHKAAWKIQSKVLNRLYTPPMGAMYNRLKQRWSNDTSDV